MNRTQIHAAALAAADRCLKGKGHIAMVDVFQEMGKLTRQGYEDWRMGRIPFLERAIQVNLSQINVICLAVHKSAAKGKLKASWTAYMKWGKGKSTPLRFTRSGDPHLEKQWATHYLHPQPKREKAVPPSGPTSAADPKPVTLFPPPARPATGDHSDGSATG